MKKQYTILTNGNGNLLLVPTKDTYEVVNLIHSCDHSYILHEDGTIEKTAGYYPLSRFTDRTIRLVVKPEEIKDDNNIQDLLPADRFFITDGDGNTKEYIDATIYLSTYGGKAARVTHGSITDTIYFDFPEDEEGWIAEDVVEADCEVENTLDSTNKNKTILYTCDDGRKIREIVPSDPEQDFSTFEHVD